MTRRKTQADRALDATILAELDDRQRELLIENLRWDLEDADEEWRAAAYRIAITALGAKP